MSSGDASAADAVPASLSGDLGRLLPQLAELSLLLVVIHEWAIEGEKFERIALLATAGFVVHHVLPAAWRLPFFCALSMGAIGLVFGRDALWLVGVGLVFVGVLDLPLPHLVRVVLVALLGLGLAAMRAEFVAAPWPDAVWPILGSMFMFRLVVYLYDLRYSPTRPTFWQTLAYFFMLPNPCFPLFPVVDFATFRRSHYDDDAHRIYEVGLTWILRGVTHLVLYRFVYQHLVLSPDDVRTPVDFAQHALALFLLYLRVSGQFHVIVGMLHLFGFNLPATHRYYLLSSSFNDFWRRANIYWKDFMAKHFFFPVYFRVRRWGTTTALVVATVVVFLSTWLLHSYQWFWLLGTFPLTGPDAVFWGVLGVLVLANTLYETKHGRERRVAERARSPRAVALHALRIAGTLGAISVLWALWSSENLEEWWALVRALDPSAVFQPIPGAGTLVPGLLALGVVPLLGAAVSGGAASDGAPAGADRGGRSPRGDLGGRGAWRRWAAIAALIALAQPAVAERIGGDASRVLAGLRSDELNAQDTTLIERGHYENLLGAQRPGSRTWEHAVAPDAGFPAKESGDFQGRVLLPNVSVLVRGQRFTTNRWGMRDRDYPRVAPQGTHRIAMIGSSHLLGLGVADGETFESLLEARLAREPLGRDTRRVEILNFGMAAYSPLQSYRMLDRLGLGFSPDAVVMFLHRGDDWRTSRHVARVLSERQEIPYAPISAIAAQLGASAGSAPPMLRRALEAGEREMLAWTYGELVASCKRNGCSVLGVYLPQVGERDEDDPRKHAVIDPAREAGLPVLDLSGVYGDRDPRTLQAPGAGDHKNDTHPNAAGHEMVAERLYRELAAHRALVGL